MLTSGSMPAGPAESLQLYSLSANSLYNEPPVHWCCPYTRLATQQYHVSVARWATTRDSFSQVCQCELHEWL